MVKNKVISVVTIIAIFVIFGYISYITTGSLPMLYNF